MGTMDESNTIKPFQASESESLKLLHGFISCLLQRDENDQHIKLIPKDASVFLHRLCLECSDAASTAVSIRILRQAHSAAAALDSSFQDALAHLNDQKGIVYGTKPQPMETPGVEILTDDIMALVAKQVYGNAGQKMIIRFSHVCRRWRNIALSLPQLWCRPSTGFDRKLTQALIVRSRAAPLHLRCLRDPGMVFQHQLIHFIDDFRPHFDRCRCFSLLLEDDRDIEGMLQFTRDLGTKCDGLQVPVLEMLNICCLICDREANRTISLDDRFHFYASWDMPQLRSLHVTNFIPRSVFGDSLKSLTAELYVERGRGIWDMRLFLNFLASVPQLEDLSIILLHSAFCFLESDANLDSDNTPQRNRITLENVKRLTLDIDDGNSDEFEALYNVLNSIVTPNVTELSLRVNVTRWSEICGWLDAMFVETEDDRFDHVERLSIKMIQSTYSTPYRLGQVFQKLPHLTDLSMSADTRGDGPMSWHLPTRATASSTTSRPIEKSLTMRPQCSVRLSGFQDGPSFYFDEARKLVEAMKKAEHWERIEKIEIVGCPSLTRRTKEDIEKIVPGRKLVWVD